MAEIIKLADFLAEKINCSPVGELIWSENLKTADILELIERRISYMEKNNDNSDNLLKINSEKELIFLKNLVKRISR